MQELERDLTGYETANQQVPVEAHFSLDTWRASFYIKTQVRDARAGQLPFGEYA